MEITLPTKKNEILEKNPKTAVFFGKPKSGKTTAIASLEDNLIIDTENGTDYVQAMAIKAPDLDHLWAIRNTLDKQKAVYTYITIDTITKLEEIVLPLAKKLYRATPMGKNFTDSDVRKLANGAGYLYCREAFFQVINWFKPYCKYLILIGHANATQINKEGKELAEMDLDLSGKLKRLISADVDALGYIYREKNKTIVSFEGGEDAIVEARPKHLRGKKIVIAESDEEDNLSTFMNQIYI